MAARNTAIASLAVLVASIAVSACQGEYPLPPTPCDEWCEANRLSRCGRAQPATCVVQCQELGLSSRPDCVAAVHAALVCLQRQPPLDTCKVGDNAVAAGPCASALNTLLGCVYDLPTEE